MANAAHTAPFSREKLANKLNPRLNHGGGDFGNFASVLAFTHNLYFSQVYNSAFFDGVPAGTCLLTPKELEPCHPVSPWLAGLYVAPEFRRRGIGKLLIRAIEDQARKRGNAQLYLYADDATSYYEKLEWRVVEQTMWKDHPMALMARDLSAC